MVLHENLTTPVTRECDVLVCGGGFAGISAALAAARMKKKVLLLEKEYLLGGLGTAGLVTIYLPLCDGLGRQVSFGIAEELLRLSVSEGAEARYPDAWLDPDSTASRSSQRFSVQFNPSVFAILAEQLLKKEGVEILYGTYAVSAARQGDKISHVVFENKSGRQAVTPKSVVDCTGDCDIAHFADAPTVRFSRGNVLAAWYYYLGKNGYHLNLLGFADTPVELQNESNTAKPLSERRFGGLDGAEISEMVCLSHDETLKDILKRRQTDPTVVPTSIATIPQIRMTRRMDAEYTLDESEMHQFFADSVGMVSDWRKPGPVYEVPFSCLYSGRVKNLITAGRCVGVTDGMLDIMRVIPCCAVSGQAAGTAAAMTDDFSALEVGRLQNELCRQKVVLHEKDLGL